MQQLALAIDGNLDAQLNDFRGQGWLTVKDAFNQFEQGLLTRILLAGEPGTGKTLLLQALFEKLQEEGERRAIYLSLREIMQEGVGIFERLEQFDILAIDQLELISHSPLWQHALFYLLNRAAQTSTQVIVASSLPLPGLSGIFPDLLSRLQQFTCFNVPTWQDDQDHHALLSAVLLRRAWVLDDTVFGYLLQHGPRQTGKLIQVLDRIAEEHRGAQKKLSLQMVKRIISGFS